MVRIVIEMKMLHCHQTGKRLSIIHKKSVPTKLLSYYLIEKAPEDKYEIFSNCFNDKTAVLCNTSDINLDILKSTQEFYTRILLHSKHTDSD